MKKDDFKKSIDNINPDAYMGNRLKAKITTDMPVRNNRRVTVSITAFCLAFAIIFGVAFLTPPTAPTSQTTTDSAVVEKRINPFIIVASAAEVQNTEAGAENKVLELNEEYPYEMFLKVKDTTNLSDEQKGEYVLDLAEDFEEYGLTEKVFDTARAMVCSTENIALIQYAFNDFKFDLENIENAKSINVKNTSKYGQMVHHYNLPKFGGPEHGNDITINSKDFDFEKSSFYWDHTEEMEKAFNENINTPFSTFNDTITFTVEYNDGSKAIGVVDLVFDDSGNAKVVCRNYDYVA
ncbi:MAG: hypothetical protein E7522_11375 [Ruminococcaceae bacterium]|nr:hypothetical protein [Oscillospiraceae bacterium]